MEEIAVNEDSVTLKFGTASVTISFKDMSLINGLIAKEVAARRCDEPIAA